MSITKQITESLIKLSFVISGMVLTLNNHEFIGLICLISSFLTTIDWKEIKFSNFRCHDENIYMK